jgi:hypothetical protein
VKPENESPVCWTPAHEVEIGGKIELVVIEDMAQTECPVSRITPQADQLVREITSANSVKIATGAVMFGMDSAEWNPIWYDAVLLAEIEKQKISDAADKMSRANKR